MPTAADYETQPSPRFWTVTFLVAGVMLMLFWYASIADPCLLGYVLGQGDPRANPIAITECRASPDGHIRITNGDAIFGLGSLALLAGLFACVCALMDPSRGRWNVVAIAVASLTIASVVHGLMRVTFLGAEAAVLAFLFLAWSICVVVVVIGALTGTAIAAGTVSESR